MKNKWSWILVVLGLLLAFKQGFSVWRLWKSGDQVRLAANKLTLEEQKNQELKKRLAEIDTPEFIEQEARDKLGYGREGETILLLPEQDTTQLPNSKSQENKPNWLQWWELYIRI